MLEASHGAPACARAAKTFRPAPAPASAAGAGRKLKPSGFRFSPCTRGRTARCGDHKASHRGGPMRSEVIMDSIKQRAIKATEIFLERRGYEVVSAGWSCPEGKVDMVARDGECVVFLEVTASEGGFAEPQAPRSLRESLAARSPTFPSASTTSRSSSWVARGRLFATASTLFRRSDPPEASRRARAAGPPSYWLSVPGLSGLGPMHRQPSGPRCDVGRRPTSARFAARGPARLSARSRCALRSMPPIGRHHCALRSRRRPRARRLPMGRRPPAGRLSRRVIASLDCSQGSQSAGRASTGAHESTLRQLNESSRFRGLMQDVHLCSQTRLRHVRCAK